MIRVFRDLEQKLWLKTTIFDKNKKVAQKL